MILILLYQCITGLLAWINYTILRSKGDIGKAMHMANGALHLAAATAIGYFTQWHYGLACLLFTRVVFDTVLNILRSLGVGYVSPAPDSVVDQWEKKLVFRIAAIVHKKRTIITDREIEWTAIGFRIFILITATTILFL
jgi:hypothetical protein